MVLLWYVSDFAVTAAAVANEAAETQVPSEGILEAVEHKEAAMTSFADVHGVCVDVRALVVTTT